MRYYYSTTTTSRALPGSGQCFLGENLILLREEDYIDALLLAPRLDYVKRWVPENWPLAFFDTLHLIPQKDYRLIEAEMKRTIRFRRTHTNVSNSRYSDRGSLSHKDENY